MRAFINYIYISHKTIKRPAHVSESRPKLNTKILFFFSETDRRRWRRRCYSILSGVPDSSWAPSSSCQQCLGRPPLHRRLRTRDRTRNLAVYGPTLTHWTMWAMYFHPKCVCIYPRTSQNLQGIEIWKIKILTPSGSEPRSTESYTVIIPLDHWFIYRNIRNEYINFIWNHLVSHINFRFLKQNSNIWWFT